MQIQKTNFTTKKLLATVLVVALLLLSWLAYSYATDKWPFTLFADDASQADGDSNYINYNPPTEQEVAEGQAAKKRGENQSENQVDKQSTSPESDKKTSVNVGISYADIYQDNLEIRAFTNGVIEGNGTCKATVVKKDNPSIRITKESKAFIDTSTTQCQPIYIPTSQLQTGTWTVSVLFSSPSHQGTSETMEITAP